MQVKANLPLSGIRVLEMGQNIAGPYASEILSSLGAQVVKIERPETGMMLEAGDRRSGKVLQPLFRL